MVMCAVVLWLGFVITWFSSRSIYAMNGSVADAGMGVQTIYMHIQNQTVVAYVNLNAHQFKANNVRAKYIGTIN
jgi:glycerol kinase